MGISDLLWVRGGSWNDWLGCHDLLENFQTRQILADSVKFNDILVLRMSQSQHQLIHVLFKHLFVTDSLGVCILEWSGRVHKLASQSIGTIHVIVILFTQPSFILWWNMFLFLEFFVSMGKSTIISELAFTGKLPVATHLCLVFNLKRLGAASTCRNSSCWRIHNRLAIALKLRSQHQLLLML